MLDNSTEKDVQNLPADTELQDLPKGVDIFNGKRELVRTKSGTFCGKVDKLGFFYHETKKNDVQGEIYLERIDYREPIEGNNPLQEIQKRQREIEAERAGYNPN